MIQKFVAQNPHLTSEANCIRTIPVFQYMYNSIYAIIHNNSYSHHYTQSGNKTKAVGLQHTSPVGQKPEILLIPRK